MSNEPFAHRVRELRDSWAERRLVRTLAAAHDHHSQLQLLETLHRWASESCEDVARVYGEGVAAWVDPIGFEAADGAASFHAMVAGYTVIFLLWSPDVAASRWSVTATVLPGGAQDAAIAGPERRHGHWTRGRIEDLLLGLLSAHERAAAAR